MTEYSDRRGIGLRVGNTPQRVSERELRQPQANALSGELTPRDKDLLDALVSHAVTGRPFGMWASAPEEGAIA